MKCGTMAGLTGTTAVPAIDYLYTQANVPLNGATQYEMIAQASVDSRLWTGHWSIECTLGSDYGVVTEHLLHVTNSYRIVALTTGAVRVYTGANRELSAAALTGDGSGVGGAPASGDTLLFDINLGTGAWSVAVNGGTPVSGTALSNPWVAGDLYIATKDDVSSEWSGSVVYPAIGL